MTAPEDRAPLATAVFLSTYAMLMARGCPDDALDHAFQFLMGRRIPDDAPDMLHDLDEAIRVARAMTEP